jgi:hypothetical protein
MRMDRDWIEEFIARDVVKARKLLAKMIRAAGVSQQEVDRRLGRRIGYTSNIVTGRVKLTKDHMTLILWAIGVHPYLFYSLLHPKDQPFKPFNAKATSDFAHLLGLADVEVDEEAPPAPAPRPPVLDWAQFRRLIHEAVEQALAAREAAKPKRRPRKRRRPARPK